jgi:hypothetical protein
MVKAIGGEDRTQFAFQRTLKLFSGTEVGILPEGTRLKSENQDIDWRPLI